MKTLSKQKKIYLFIAIIVMAVALAFLSVPLSGSGAEATDETEQITFINGSGTSKAFLPPANILTTDSSSEVVLANGSFYAVKGTVNLTAGLKINGTTVLILCDGATLNVSNPGKTPIYKGVDNASLSIKIQTTDLTQAGSMNVTADSGKSAIDLYSLNLYGNITVKGGDATGNNNAGTGIISDLDVNCCKLTVTGGLSETGMPGDAVHGDNITFRDTAVCRLEGGTSTNQQLGRAVVAETECQMRQGTKAIVRESSESTKILDQQTFSENKNIMTTDPESSTYILYNSHYLAVNTPDTVKYLDADGTEKGTDDYTIIKNATKQANWQGWLVAEGEVSLTAGARLSADTHIILKDGAKLNISNADDHAIYIASHALLTVYAQTTQLSKAGKMTAKCTSTMLSAFSGGNLIINGGTVEAIAKDNYAISNPDYSLTLNGGYLYAHITDRSDNPTVRTNTINFNGGSCVFAGALKPSQDVTKALSASSINCTGENSFYKSENLNGSSIVPTDSDDLTNSPYIAVNPPCIDRQTVGFAVDGKERLWYIGNAYIGTYSCTLDSNKKYIITESDSKNKVAFDETTKKVSLTEEGTPWEYKDGSFYTTVTKEETFLFFFKRKVSTYYYLTYVDGALATTTEPVRMSAAGISISNEGHNFQEEVCNNCKMPEVEPGTTVDVEVVASKQTKKFLFLNIPSCTADYKITVKTAKDKDIASIGYSFDNKTKTTAKVTYNYTTFASNKKKFYLYVTDIYNQETVWYYDGKSITKQK